MEFSAPKVRPIVKKIAKEKSILTEVLEEMSKLFPKMENDLTLRTKLGKVVQLPYSPDPSAVAQLFIDIEEVFGKMSADSMSDQEKFLILLKKIHPRTFQEMRQDRFYKRRSETYAELKQSLYEKAEEDWQEKHLVQLKKENVHALVQQPSSSTQGSFQPRGEVPQGKCK